MHLLAAPPRPAAGRSGAVLAALPVFESTGWDGPGLLASGGADLSYWDLHGFLLLPTAFLLTSGRPTLLAAEAPALTRQASFAFIGFIVCIAVAQAFLWDSVGAQIGIWEFNPAKCTGLGEATLLPLEEVLWLFHHVRYGLKQPSTSRSGSAQPRLPKHAP